jgi:UDP-2-acetamido-2,6-beta-L-arabino-hexul-4-ose reductase
VGELVTKILEVIDLGIHNNRLEVLSTYKAKVSEILKILEYFKSSYIDRSEIPSLKNSFELQLFNTFRSFLDIENFYPRKITQHADQRGAFVEIARCGIQGQTSFSTTVPGVTRGNHFHTRKIERFAVIKGKAQIQLRKIGTDEIINFFLDGENPSYVDMPIWYTHNIKNIGTEDLYTIFWINEPYNPADPDTYFVEV